MIFNDEFGKLDDLPFDINKRRISLKYSLAESDDNNKIQSMCGSMSKCLKGYIKQILEKNPIKGEIVLLIEPQEKEQRGGNKYVNDTD